MRILLVSDAWYPQVNGVVRTLTQVRDVCRSRGLELEVIGPESFRSVPCPTYPDIPLVLLPRRRLARMIDEFGPEAVHIATEGPLGMAARRIMLARGWPFTTSYHTRFPEYVAARFPVPLSWGYAVMKWFHRPSRGVMVATESMRRDLESRGFVNIVPWTRGVDTELFRPGLTPALQLPKPVYLYVGRVAVEKNIEAFLSLDLPGSKLVVGDGPQLPELRRRYPDVHFAGMKEGEDLARHYAAGDVFVFPSRTDTFGLVLLEALACALPVAAYPVPGPLDVVGPAGVGALDEDLKAAALRAAAIPSERCRAHAERHSWTACVDQFLAQLVPFLPHRSRAGRPVGRPSEMAAPPSSGSDP